MLISAYSDKDNPYNVHDEHKNFVLLTHQGPEKNEIFKITFYNCCYELTKQADRITQMEANYEFADEQSKEAFKNNTNYIREQLETAYLLTGAQHKEEAFHKENAAFKEIQEALQALTLLENMPLLNPIDDDGLIQYLCSQEIPPEVKALAERGRGKTIQKQRNPNWIYEVFGESEADILNKLKMINPPKTWTINQINKVYEDLTKKYPRNPTNPNYGLARQTS